MFNDLRFAFRALRRSPGFTLVAVITLALGIGANTALFSVADAVLFRPLPYPEPERIVKIEHGPVRFSKVGITASRQMEQSPLFNGAGIYATGGLNAGADASAERVRAAAVSAGFFQAMGTAPMIGRPFTDAEANALERVVVIGHDLWRRRFDQRRELDQPLVLNGQPYTVVGVMPPRYAFPDSAEVWIPTGADRQITGAAFAPTGIARLAASTTMPAAVKEAERIKYRGEPKHPMDLDVEITPLREELVGSVRPLFGVVAAAGLLVLLVACINTANLLLARISSREREIAVRRALGASRARLVRYLLCESMLLSLLAGLLAIPAAIVTLAGVTALLPATLHGIADVAIDGRAAFVTSVLCVTCTLVFGLFPSLSTHAAAGTLLRAGTATARPFWRRFRAALVMSEVAASLVLLAGALTVVGTVTSLMRADIGARGDRVLSFQLTLPMAKYDTGARVRDFYDRLDARLRAVGSIASVAVSTMMPGSRETGIGVRISVEGLPEQKVESHALFIKASPDYFKTMGIDLVAGRPFADSDHESAPPVAIVSERVARAYGLEPPQLIGRRFVDSFAQKKPTFAEIIGVVRDVRHRGPEGEAGAQVYRPFAQSPTFGTLYVAAKAAGDPQRVAPDVRTALRAVDPSLPPYNLRTFDEIRAAFVAERRFAMMLMTAFAALTASLAAIGLYGVMSYVVQLRTREIGIRVALGATPASVLRGTMTHGMWYAAAGTVAGSAAAMALSRVFMSKVPGLQQVDAATLATTATAMLVLAACTTWIPARRAARVDPVQALRTEP